MNPETINNLTRIKKILSIEFNEYMPIQNKNEAYRDFYVYLINCIDSIRAMIEIANRPDEYIKTKKRCNPDGDKRTNKEH